MLIIAILALGALAVAAVTLPDASLTGWGVERGDAVQIAVYGGFACLLAGAIVARYRGRLGHAVRDALSWIVIGMVVLTAYTYRDLWRPVADRVWAELNPATVVSTEPGEAIINRRRDGQFALDMVANATKLRFVFDTGASSVVLRAEDAVRLGIAVDTLSYRVPVSTANGRALAAEIRLDSLSAGSITQRNVRALVARAGTLGENLLGQTFLERLTSYAVENNRLVFRAR